MKELLGLVAMRRALTEKKAALTTEYNKRSADITATLAEVETQILAAMNKSGLKSARTDSGTVTLRTAVKYHVTDWQAVDALVKETSDNTFFHRRLSTTRLAQYLDEGNELPDGINKVSTTEIAITKPKTEE